MYYLIDYENVHFNGLSGFEALSCDDTVVIFHNSTNTILISGVAALLRAACSVKHMEVTIGTPNALDFQLSSYLGYLMLSQDEAVIVSADGGYDCLISFWAGYNKKVSRQLCISSKSCLVQENDPEARLKSLLCNLFPLSGKTISPQVVQLAKGSSTCQQLNSQLCKTYDSDKAGKIYRLLRDNGFFAVYEIAEP